MTARSFEEAKALIRANTRPIQVAGLPIRQWTADEITPIWEATEADLERQRMAPPFWAFPWAGGQAVSRWLLEHPKIVAGRCVLDLAAGGGLGAIAAALAGARPVTANDIDPLCEAAVALNSELNDVEVEWLGGDLLDFDPPRADVVLACDVFYEKAMAERFLTFLARCRDAGATVIVGDPGRTYFPRNAFRPLAAYSIPTTEELENAPFKVTRVWGW